MLRRHRGAPLRATLVTGGTSPTFIRDAKHWKWPVLHRPVDMLKLVFSLRQLQI